MPPPKTDHEAPGADIIARVLQDVRAAALSTMGTSLPAEVLERAEYQARARDGGDRHYAMKAPSRVKLIRLGSALGTGADVRSAFEQAGVRRRWGYSLMLRRL